jgi:hypothetical protein
MFILSFWSYLKGLEKYWISIGLGFPSKVIKQRKILFNEMEYNLPPKGWVGGGGEGLGIEVLNIINNCFLSKWLLSY